MFAFALVSMNFIPYSKASWKKVSRWKKTQITQLQRNKLVHNIYGHNIRYEYLKDVYRGPYIF